MPKREIRIEVSDDQGNRYTMILKGEVTREKALRMLDVMELLGEIPGSQRTNSDRAQLSKFAKVKDLVERHFPIGWFSSKGVLMAYEEEFHEPVSLSTVSTYLTRMVDRGILTKINAANNRKYQMVDKRFAEQLEPRKNT